MKVIPKIFNGKNELLLNETIVFTPESGLRIDIPIQYKNVFSLNTSIVQISLNFNITDNVKSEVGINVKGNNVQFLIDFQKANPVVTCLSKPYSFRVGDVPFLMYLSWQSAGGDQTMVHISLYGESK